MLVNLIELKVKILLNLCEMQIFNGCLNRFQSYRKFSWIGLKGFKYLFIHNRMQCIIESNVWNLTVDKLNNIRLLLTINLIKETQKFIPDVHLEDIVLLTSLRIRCYNVLTLLIWTFECILKLIPASYRASSRLLSFTHTCTHTLSLSLSKLPKTHTDKNHKQWYK